MPDHERAIDQDVIPLRYVCRHGLFDLWRPYTNDNQSTCEQTTIKRKRKRQRTSAFTEQEFEAIENHNKIRDILDKSSSHIIGLGRNAGYFKVDDINTNSCQGFIDKDIIPTDKLFSSHVVEHSSNSPSIVHIKDGWYIIPAQTNYLISDDLSLQLLIDHVHQHGLFDVVVMDPPWYNKSAKRSGKYSFLSLWQIKSLPVPQLLNNHSLIMVWVTNKPKYINFTKGELFAHWGVQYLAQWHWVKVTRTGELVMDLDSLHKRPYETLIIGRYHSTPTKDNSVQQERQVHNNKLNDDTVVDNSGEVQGIQGCKNSPNNCTDDSSGVNIQQATKTVKCYSTEKAHIDKELLPQDMNSQLKDHHKPIPDHVVICSVPCQIHSRKPCLNNILSDFVHPGARCLEMFARNLTTGWTSWGNEVLKFQHTDYFDMVSQETQHIS